MTNSFAQLRVLFEACVDLPEVERSAWLDHHVADAGQRLELERMLLADGRDEGFLRHDVVSHIGRLGDAGDSEFDPGTLIGKRFGAFELLSLLGRGGQGTVFLARRVDADFEQSAAVKLLRRGLHDAIEHRRFRREREILARFEHPGVARLIDGGVSSEGVPFLAMEYVDGAPIDRWCATQSLDESGRLRLFSELCAVVAAAHRHLIVHRDLKPSNVLVTSSGEVKVLDFGIARLLDEEESGTELNRCLITPGYGAPEQASGGTITLATDVHALGVLLRVLLTGEVPTGAPAGFPQPLKDQLPLDLRWIVGKACAPESELRYRDAAELRDDLQRYLDGRPVQAHPPSHWYQVRKFAKRHRGGIAVTAAVAIGILASLGTALWQAKIAREQLLRAEATRDFLIGVFDAAEEFLPRDARPTPDNLVRAAVARLDTDSALDPLSRADFLATLAKISFSSNDYEQAIRLAEHAAQLLGANGQADSRGQLAAEIVRANALVRAGRAEEAAQALTPRLALIRAQVDDVAVDGLGAFSSANIALGRFDEALAAVQEGIAVAEAHNADIRSVLSMRTGYGYALANAGRLSESGDVLEDTVRRWKAAGAAPDKTYAGLIGTLAAVKAKTGHTDEAVDLLKESLQLRREIYTAPHEKIADALQNLAVLMGERGDFAESNVLLRESEQMYRTLFGETHPQSLSSAVTQANLEAKQGRIDEALTTLGRVTALCDEHRLDKVPACLYSIRTQADLYLQLDRLDQAVVAAERSLLLRKALYGTDHPEYAVALTTWAFVQFKRGEPDSALETVQQATAIYRAQKAEQSLPMSNVLRIKASALLALKRGDDALAAIDEALAIAAKLAAKDVSRRFTLLALRAETLSALGRGDEARAVGREAVALPPFAKASPAQKQRLEAIAR